MTCRRARFVIPKPDMCDWTHSSVDDKTMVVASMRAVESGCCNAACVFASDLPWPWISQRAVTVTATASSFVGHLTAVLCALSGVYGDEPTDVRLLVPNATFDSMTAHGGRPLHDLESVADVVTGGFEEYPLIGETAVHVIGRPTAVAEFACLLDESLCDNVAADGRPVENRQPTERIGTATLGTAETWPFRVPVRHVRRAVTSSPRIVAQPSRPESVTDGPIVEHTSRSPLSLVTEPSTRRVPARSRPQAMKKAASTWG